MKRIPMILSVLVALAFGLALPAAARTVATVTSDDTTFYVDVLEPGISVEIIDADSVAVYQFANDANAPHSGPCPWTWIAYASDDPEKTPINEGTLTCPGTTTSTAPSSTTSTTFTSSTTSSPTTTTTVLETTTTVPPPTSTTPPAPSTTTTAGPTVTTGPSSTSSTISSTPEPSVPSISPEPGPTPLPTMPPPPPKGTGTTVTTTTPTTVVIVDPPHVTVTTPTAAPAEPPASELPRTGSDLIVWGVIGGVVLAAGALIVRPRRQS